MTKSVRIENADTSKYKIKVHIERKNLEGDWVRAEKESQLLSYPTALTTMLIHEAQRLVVEEIGE